jgi:hypothetical protein
MAERNTFSTELEEVAGAQKLFDCFGYWPNFHDAEVISVHLNRVGPSALLVHTWDTKDSVDAQGYFVQQTHVLVSFLLYEISELSLEAFNRQNVLFGLELVCKRSHRRNVRNLSHIEFDNRI